MRFMAKRVLLGILILGLFSSSTVFAEGLTATRLRCEYAHNPLGIDTAKPRFFWQLISHLRGQRQTAYQILVAADEQDIKNNRGELWDSGKVESDRSIQVEYAGQPLESKRKYHWKVRVWDKDGMASAYSEEASFEMGLLQPGDWQAKWIELSDDVPQPVYAPPNNGYHSQLATTPDQVKWVIIDLGDTKTFDSIKLYPARPYDCSSDTPGFLFPLRLKLDVSDSQDFEEFKTPIDQTGGDIVNPETKPLEYHFASSSGRYVRLMVTRMSRHSEAGYGFALNEMEVLADGNSIAKKKNVTALDSIEAPAWSKENLVDGVTQTVTPAMQTVPSPAPMMRKTFVLAGPVRQARLYATCLGAYRMSLNGKQVGNEILDPGWTNFNCRVQYQTYDVTNLMRRGVNAIGAVCGDGWCAGRVMTLARTRPRLIVRLDIVLADGRTQTIVSDETWRGTLEGPIRGACLFDGEWYDARREMPGWDTAKYDDADWKPVRTASVDGVRLVSQLCEPIRITQELRPIALSEPAQGIHVFDLGQNFAGIYRLKLHGPRGTTVKLRFGEMLQPDGQIYTNNLTNAIATDTYILRGGGTEIYEPHFTYHGFRYVEVTGLAAKPALTDLTGCVSHADMVMTGTFACSSPLLNKLMENIVWTQRSNVYSVPTDCPQRGERLGWMGDAQIFAQAGIFNMDMARFYGKYVQDIRDTQTNDGRYPIVAPLMYPPTDDDYWFCAPGWADAGVIIPWRLYENYADTRLLEQHWESMKRYIDFVYEHNPDLLWKNRCGQNYGDHLNGDTMVWQNWPKSGGAVPKEVMATAFLAHSTDLLARMAGVLGRDEESKKYGELARGIREAFNHAYVKPDGTIQGDTQTGYALALHFDLLPESLRQKAMEHMVRRIGDYGWRISTGIQGTNWMMMNLAAMGRSDVAYRLLNNREVPSWGYMIDNGATTVWERWDGYVKGRGFQNPMMNSFNHYAIGAVGEWMWRNIPGLNPDPQNPGWKHFVIHPRPGGGLSWAKGQYDSIHGHIVSDWKIEKRKFTLKVHVPVGATATIYVPARSVAEVSEGGKSAEKAEEIKFLRLEDGAAVFDVEAGDYHFQSPMD